MRNVLVLLVTVLTIGGGRLAVARDADHLPLGVTVQIHDYVHLPPASLSAASEVVTGVYKSIGVRTEWLAPMRQDLHRAHTAPPGEPSHTPIAQVTMIVLTPEMTARGHIKEGILGLAAVAPEGIGRIAYVMYDRVSRQAANGAIDETELFGLVMAHEIGHLLLGVGSHSDAGLMKGDWDREDLRHFGVVTPRFSPIEADQIRAALAREPDVVAAR
jgi:hypothetical protein